MAPYIQISNLEKVFRSPKGDVIALKGIELDIQEREFMSLLGPSGCGKSTLLKIVAGLAGYSGGLVNVQGRPVQGPPDDMGIVFQRDVLLDWRTILDNVLLPIEFRRENRKHWESKAKALLELLGLKGFEQRSPWELSGGMRQRAAICRALIQEPKLLLMDEPFGALDALTRDELNLEMQRIWMAAEKTVLFITHSISEAVFLSDRVAIMSKTPGRIVETIEISLPRPRRLDIRETSEFGRYTSHIRQIFESMGLLKQHP